MKWRVSSLLDRVKPSGMAGGLAKIGRDDPQEVSEPDAI